MKDFSGKVAVVTGAASGIGRAIAERCVQAGAKVVLADVEANALERAGAELNIMGASVLCVRTDVAKRTDVEALASRAFSEFGGVHLLFNNAGVAAGGSPWQATWNDWEWVIGVNLWGVIHGVKVFTPLMLEQKTECHIVNTASGAGLTVGGLSSPYSVTKHAVVALSESLYIALEQQQSLVKVSVLCPGMVQTNVVDAERNRPADLRNEVLPLTPERQAGRAALKAFVEAGMPPAQMAEIVFDAIANEQFYILTHPEWMSVIRLRVERLLELQNPVNPGPALAKLLARGVGQPARN